MFVVLFDKLLVFIKEISDDFDQYSNSSRFKDLLPISSNSKGPKDVRYGNFFRDRKDFRIIFFSLLSKSSLGPKRENFVLLVLENIPGYRVIGQSHVALWMGEKYKKFGGDQ